MHLSAVIYTYRTCIEHYTVDLNLSSSARLLCDPFDVLHGLQVAMNPYIQVH